MAEIFVSFDYEKDRRYYYLMNAWDANSDFEFVFSDYGTVNSFAHFR